VEHADGYTMHFGGSDRAALEARLSSFRGAIPAQRRRWDAATKTWWVDPIVERMFGSLSRWATRSFSPDQVQRSSAPDSAGVAWAARGSGDSVVEGWVAPPEPKREPRPAPTSGAGGPSGPSWTGQFGGAPAGGFAGAASSRPAHEWQAHAAPLPARDPVSDAYAVLWLRPDAPWPVIKAAYRALAGIHHPDKGGANATMQEINGAYALLRQYAAGGEGSPGAAITTVANPAPAAGARHDAGDDEDEDDGFSL